MVIIWFLISLFVLLATGIHIAVGLGLTGALLLFFFGDMPLPVIAQTAFHCVNSYALAAIPFFILAGDIVLEARLADRLLDFAGVFLRRIQGGLAMGVVVACVFFAAVSGSSVASAAALGRSVVELLKHEDYPPRFVAGLVAASGGIGLLIPPSLSFILIGSMQGIPIVNLFTAGILPGILEGALIMAASYYLCKRHGWGKSSSRTFSASVKNGSNLGKTITKQGDSVAHHASENDKTFFALLRSSAGVLLMPGVVLGGIYLGFFTPTESAAVACGYALILAMVIHRSMSFQEMWKALGRSLQQSGMIYFVLIGGNLVGFAMVSLGVTDRLSEIVAVSGISKWQFLLLVNIILLLMGMVLDGISLIVLTVPILYPIAEKLGIDPIHLAVIITINVEVATVTPPVGLNLYVMSGMTGLSVAEVARGIGPLYLMQILTLLLVTYVPQISLILLKWL